MNRKIGLLSLAVISFALSSCNKNKSISDEEAIKLANTILTNQNSLANLRRVTIDSKEVNEIKQDKSETKVTKTIRHECDKENKYIKITTKFAYDNKTIIEYYIAKDNYNYFLYDDGVNKTKRYITEDELSTKLNIYSNADNYKNIETLKNLSNYIKEWNKINEEMKGKQNRFFNHSFETNNSNNIVIKNNFNYDDASLGYTRNCSGNNERKWENNYYTYAYETLTITYNNYYSKKEMQIINNCNNPVINIDDVKIEDYHI